MNNLDLIFYLAKKGAAYRQINLSTIKISLETKISQQSISRKLRELEKKGFINRNASPRGIDLIFTNEGIELLQNHFTILKNIFEDNIKSLQGKIESGFGEGAYYISLSGYVKQFKQKLDIDPFPGTLNLKVDYTKFLQFISTKKRIEIDGFTEKNRTFEKLFAYLINFNKTPSAIIIPQRTSHSKDMVEIISKYNLRQKFNLKDNDIIEISELK